MLTLSLRRMNLERFTTMIALSIPMWMLVIEEHGLYVPLYRDLITLETGKLNSIAFRNTEIEENGILIMSLILNKSCLMICLNSME